MRPIKRHSKGQRQKSSYLTHWIKDIRDSILKILTTGKEVSQDSIDGGELRSMHEKQSDKSNEKKVVVCSLKFTLKILNSCSFPPRISIAS